MTRRLVTALALTAVMLTGCSGGQGTTDEGTSREVTSSAAAVGESLAEDAAAATDAADQDGTADGAGTEPGSITGISPSEQDELAAELAAIERELDAMSLPDDTDFSDIEGALQ